VPRGGAADAEEWRVKMLDTMKQAASMRREMKQLQSELSQMTVEESSGNGAVRVVARGDMSIESVTIGPEAADAGGTQRLGHLVTLAVNAALKAAKKKAAAQMSKRAGSLGMPGLGA